MAYNVCMHIQVQFETDDEPQPQDEGSESGGDGGDESFEDEDWVSAPESDDGGHQWQAPAAFYNGFHQVAARNGDGSLVSECLIM